MKIRQAWCLTVLLALGLPPLGGEAHGQSLRLDVIAETRGPIAEPFAHVAGLLMLREDRVIVADDVAGSISWWNPRTGAHGRLARSGDGPNEVRVPTRISRTPTGGYAIYDVGASAVMIYSPDGIEERRIRIPGIVSNPKDLLIDHAGNLWISGGRLTDPRHLHVFASDGMRTAAWGDPPLTLTSDFPRIQLAGGALHLESSGQVLFSLRAPLRIVRFANASLDDMEEVVEDPALLPGLREEDVFYPYKPIPGAWALDWWHDRSTGVFTIFDRCILNVVTRKHAVDSVWDVYTRDGRRLSRTVVPHPYEVFDVLGDGLVVASYKDPATDESVVVVLAMTIGRLQEC